LARREDKLHVFTAEQGGGLVWAHREGIYQEIFYVDTLGKLCGARLGMLVVNSSFQRLALLDDRVMVIEMAATSSSNSNPNSNSNPRLMAGNELSLDQLELYDEFWESIPNTLLIPDQGRIGYSPEPEALRYLESARKRYVRFWQSVYHISAYAEIPSATERTSLPLPRSLQSVPPDLPARDLRHVLTYGSGSPTFLGLSPHPEDRDTGNDSTPSKPTQTQAQSQTRPGGSWANVGADTEGLAGVVVKKHEYGVLRSAARERGKAFREKKGKGNGKRKEGEGDGKVAGDGRHHDGDRDDDAGDGGDAPGDGGGAPGDGEDVSGDEGNPYGYGGDALGDDSHAPDEDERDRQDGDRNAGRPSEASGPHEGSYASYGHGGYDQGIGSRADDPSRRKQSDHPHNHDHDHLHAPFTLTLANQQQYDEDSPDGQYFAPTPPTPDLSFNTRLSSVQTDSTASSLETYREYAGASNPRIKLVSPEAMDRIIYAIAMGQRIDSAKVSTPEVSGMGGGGG